MLIRKLHDYKIDPFGGGPTRHITTGSEIDCHIGKENCEEFIKDRQATGEVYFYQPIRRLKMKTGLAKQVEKRQSASVRKEDRQAFRTMFSLSIDLEEALRFPLTSLPLSIEAPDGKLRPAQKQNSSYQHQSYLLMERKPGR